MDIGPSQVRCQYRPPPTPTEWNPQQCLVVGDRTRVTRCPSCNTPLCRDHACMPACPFCPEHEQVQGPGEPDRDERGSSRPDESQSGRDRGPSRDLPSQREPLGERGTSTTQDPNQAAGEPEDDAGSPRLSRPGEGGGEETPDAEGPAYRETLRHLGYEDPGGETPASPGRLATPSSTPRRPSMLRLGESTLTQRAGPMATTLRDIRRGLSPRWGYGSS